MSRSSLRGRSSQLFALTVAVLLLMGDTMPVVRAWISTTSSANAYLRHQTLSPDQAHRARVAPLRTMPDDAPSDVEDDDDDDTTTTTVPTEATVEQLKADLIRMCRGDPSKDSVLSAVVELERVAEQVGVGQASSLPNLISGGDWELLYTTEADDTRSSPFFWAFRKAFGAEKANQIYEITDSIPAPLKEIGPVYQRIEYDPATQSGKFVSKVKVATLGGMATSIMTTRASIVKNDGVDGLVLQIDTTKPEESSAINTLLGPLGSVVNENSPAFPSGQVLEQISPGSSQVILRTTYCDEGLRISRNKNLNNPSDSLCIFVRKEFSSYEFL